VTLFSSDIRTILVVMPSALSTSPILPTFRYEHAGSPRRSEDTAYFFFALSYRRCSYALNDRPDKGKEAENLRDHNARERQSMRERIISLPAEKLPYLLFFIRTLPLPKTSSIHVKAVIVEGKPKVVIPSKTTWRISLGVAPAARARRECE
jgi:hypothetical protein